MPINFKAIAKVKFNFIKFQSPTNELKKFTKNQRIKSVLLIFAANLLQLTNFNIIL
jgi:hypothetical protein